MKKKIKLLVCGLLLSVALVGCGSSENSSEPSENKYEYHRGRKFLVIKYGTWDEVYVDVDTKVQYLNFETYRGNTSILIDSDGKPILYEGEVE